jgi:transcriptional regulator with XRE-family HTH domain
VKINKARRPTRVPAKIHPLHAVRQITGLTQAEFAKQIGISTILLKLIEQSRRPLTPRTKDAIHLFTGIDPLSWSKKKLQSTLGEPFNQKTYSLWQMVRQNENEDAPKRVLNDRIKALELIGTLMQQDNKGVLWEHEFRQFILKMVKHYNLAKPLAFLKRELEQRGEKWPEEAFAAPKAPAYKATIATALLKSGI